VDEREHLDPIVALMTRSGRSPHVWQAACALALYRAFWVCDTQWAPVISRVSERRASGLRYLVNVPDVLGRRCVILRAAAGLGKTFLACLLASIKRTLVLVPAPVGAQWAKEALCCAVTVVNLEAKSDVMHFCDWLLDQAPPDMIIITHNLYTRLEETQQQILLKGAELLVIDEVQKESVGPTLLKQCFTLDPKIPVLMLSGTICKQTRAQLAEALRVADGHLKGITWQIDAQALAASKFPCVKLEIVHVKMTKYERIAYDAMKELYDLEVSEAAEQTEHLGRRNSELHRRFWALILPSASRSAEAEEHKHENYAMRVLRQSEESIRSARAGIRGPLTRLLTRSLTPLDFRAPLVEILGEELTASIFEDAGRLSAQVTARFTAAVSQKKFHELMKQWRKQTMAVTHLNNELQALDRVDPDSTCHVCFDAPILHWHVGHCGHKLCGDCVRRLGENRRSEILCPFCRQYSLYVSIEKLRAAQIRVEKTGSLAGPQGTSFVTSSKLTQAIHCLKEAKAAGLQSLIVCPSDGAGDRLMQSIRKEFQEAGLHVGCLQGASQGQEAKLREWRRLRYDGLLISPGTHGVDFSTASCIILLTTLMARGEMEQVISRIVRQGNENVALGRPVTVRVLCALDTEEDKAERLDVCRSICARRAAGLEVTTSER